MREIGYDQPCYIIAEAGINHNGSLHIAKHMADAAKVAGADAVKYQTFLPTEINYPNITYAETEELKKHCDDIGIVFLSTPHSYTAIDFLEPLVPMYKIASPRLFEKDFMNYVLDKGKSVIVSINEKARHKDIDFLLSKNIDTIYRLECRLNEEDWKTIEALPGTVFPVDSMDEMRIVSEDRISYIYFMHTVCQYPAHDPKFWQLGIRMHLYHNIVWGYSDHMLPDKNACVEAVDEYGVALVEKHFKLVENCPDASHSLYARELKEMVAQIRQVEAAKAQTS